MKQHDHAANRVAAAIMFANNRRLPPVPAASYKTVYVRDEEGHPRFRTEYHHVNAAAKARGDEKVAPVRVFRGMDNRVIRGLRGKQWHLIEKEKRNAGDG